MTETRRHKTLSILSIVMATGQLLFWMAFFAVGPTVAKPPGCFVAFENAVSVPDLALATVLLTGGIVTLKRGVLGKRLLAVGGGALLYVALLDISFNLQNGMYGISLLDMLVNGIINLSCLALGMALAAKMT